MEILFRRFAPVAHLDVCPCLQTIDERERRNSVGKCLTFEVLLGIAEVLEDELIHFLSRSTRVVACSRLVGLICDDWNCEVLDCIRDGITLTQSIRVSHLFRRIESCKVEIESSPVGESLAEVCLLGAVCRRRVYHNDEVVCNLNPFVV